MKIDYLNLLIKIKTIHYKYKQQKKLSSIGYFLAFTNTKTATPAIMAPNIKNTCMGKLPEEVATP